MLQDIFINLNILSKIKPYDKIYINKNNLISIEYNSAFQGFFRFLYNNSREKNLTNLILFYQNIFDYVDELLNSQYLNGDLIHDYINKDNEEFFKIYNNLDKLNYYLENSSTGIKNLKKTYSTDIVTDSKLDIIINNINLYTHKISKKINMINLNIHNNKEKSL